MLRVKETFHVGTADGTRTFAEGDIVAAAPEGCEAFFEPADDSEPKPARTRRTPAKQAAKKDD